MGVRPVRRLNLGAHPYDGMRDLALAARPFVDTKPGLRELQGVGVLPERLRWPPPDRSLQVQGHDPGQIRAPNRESANPAS
jgi:hypothetical protein